MQEILFFFSVCVFFFFLTSTKRQFAKFSDKTLQILKTPILLMISSAHKDRFINICLIEDFDLSNLVPTFDDSLMMNSVTSLEYPPKVSQINGRYIKPSCST